MKNLSKILGIITALALAALACQTLSRSTASPNLLGRPDVTVVALPVSPVSDPPVLDQAAVQDILVKLYAAVNPGVVSILVLTPDGEATASGFVVDANGYIVTNYHVVENETNLEVGFASGLKVHGEVIGTDLDSDIAVLQVKAPAEELHPLALGDSSQVKVGQTVVAIGNPFRLNGTMTVGIVSGLGRTVQSLHTTSDGGSFSAADVIQTDAAINPGNSGGPLLNLNGQVIGVNESIRTTTFSSQGQPVNSGIGFAISANILKRVLPSLIANGKYDYPYLGITSQNDITLAEQEALGLSQSTGVYITGVVSGGPADKGGLRFGSRNTSIDGLKAGGDLIIGVDGRAVYTYNDLIGYLVENKSPGDKVTLTVLRDGKQTPVELTLDKRPN
ncbi:MAG TPA: trypsin-like peptidase domain-containing protein [Anaerolineales bacterium]